MTPHDTSAPLADGPDGHRWRMLLTIAAVTCAVLGLVSLLAILGTAWLQGTVWPGFVAAAMIFLPLGFLLMCALVVGAALSRRRS